MTHTFVFFYLMADDVGAIRNVVPAHVAYWKALGLANYTGGPFADQSGGLITFEAKDLKEATHLAAQDPFVLKGLMSGRWIKEWVPKASAATIPTVNRRATDSAGRRKAAARPTS